MKKTINDIMIEGEKLIRGLEHSAAPYNVTYAVEKNPDATYPVTELMGLYRALKLAGIKTMRVFMDGDQHCAVFDDFINLQESPAGFGDTPEEAREALVAEIIA